MPKYVQQSIVGFLKRSQPPAPENERAPEKEAPKAAATPVIKREQVQDKYIRGDASPTPAAAPDSLFKCQGVIRPQTSPQLASPVIDLRAYQNTSPGGQYMTRDIDDDVCSSPGAQKESSGQRQYRALREVLDLDTVLFLQNGAFYELYDVDADFGTQYLQLKSVVKSTGQRVAGIPKASGDFYIRKTLGLNKRVAVADQKDGQDPAFKVQYRVIKQIFSPGSVDQESMLPETGFGLLFLENAPEAGFTAWFYNPVLHKTVSQACCDERAVQSIVCRLQPAEILIDASCDLKEFVQPICDCPVQVFSSNHFTQISAPSRHKTFKVDPAPYLPQLLSRYLCYLGLAPTQGQLDVFQIPPKRMNLPFTTLQTLELQRVERVIGQFIQTRFGRRMLHSLISGPYQRVAEIQKIWAMTDAKPINLKGIFDLDVFRGARSQAGALFDAFIKIKQIFPDEPVLETITAKLSVFDSPKELKLNKEVLNVLEAKQKALRTAQVKSINALGMAFCTEPLFEKGLQTNAAKTAIGYAEGFLIVGKAAVNDIQLEQLKKRMEYAGQLQNIHKFKIPDDVQALQNEIDSFREKQIESVVAEVFSTIEARRTELQEIYERLALRDIAQAFFKLKQKYSTVQWCRPEFVEVSPDAKNTNIFELSDAIHPLMLGKKFQAQSYTAERYALLTGPNMSGKSTFLRTIALCALLAHIGAPVPARKFRLSPLENILCRIGGYDFGASTFETEMRDIQTLVAGVSEHSLAIIDEIGRGTEQIASDAIGQAVLKRLANSGALGLISTHSNQLNLCTQELGLESYEMAFELSGKTVRFTYIPRILAAHQMSLGCEVAEMAGLPVSVVERAKELRTLMESTLQKECEICLGAAIKSQ